MKTNTKRSKDGKNEILDQYRDLLKSGIEDNEKCFQICDLIEQDILNPNTAYLLLKQL